MTNDFVFEHFILLQLCCPDGYGYGDSDSKCASRWVVYSCVFFFYEGCGVRRRSGGSWQEFSVILPGTRIA